MRTLATMAHYDPRGRVAPHVRRNIELLREHVDRLIVVSTADLQPEDESWLSERVELLRRDNFGYDFFSYRAGLLEAGELSDYDRIVVCNDTFVGPLLDYDRIFADMDARPVDFWGLTASRELVAHVQSYFVCFRPWVVRSEAFTQFWQRMTPLSDRWQVIKRYEVGLSVALESAGFRWAAYFTETRRDRVTARARMWWRAALQTQNEPAGKRRRKFGQAAGRPWNPCVALADRAVPGARLPIVKIDTLRYDPSGLQSQRLLARCEDAFPAQFADVRRYLEDTASFYPGRSGDRVPKPARPLRPLLSVVRYAAAGSLLYRGRGRR